MRICRGKRNHSVLTAVFPNMEQQSAKFLIVYNADGGIVNMVKDGLWKILSPDTYPCSLCAVSYGPVSMRAAWRKYLKTLSNEVVIHHKDDFAQDYPDHGIALPAILLCEEGKMPQVLIDKEEMDTLQDVDELIGLTRLRLAQRQSSDLVAA